MKRKIMIAGAFVMLCSITLLGWTTMQSLKSCQFAKYAAFLGLADNYQIRKVESHIGWFGEGSRYYLLAYSESDMAKQRNYLSEKTEFQKSDESTNRSFVGLFSYDLNKLQVYRQIVANEFAELYYREDITQNVLYYIYVIDERQIAVFISVG